MGANPDEIEQLFRERYVAFRNVLATATGSHESARDAVQEAFARALRSREQYRGEGSLAAWVWRIALRVAAESARQERAAASLDGVGFNPVLIESERDPELAAALRALAPRRRLVVFLHYFGDLSYREIAEITAISEGTVAATLAQAREALRLALEGHGALETQSQRGADGE